MAAAATREWWLADTKFLGSFF
ncbi:hypothetical protein CCACVL1_26631 [Corchorus capsularis]|uniref:Uncharacterized protein n=1 Tax=Corchorus capsularis TaxID=210143 RepID=A0A1R3GE41_COCAP|nr:hypothetical protein CCACVL1_26631 [Corchorus capsularis]